MGDVREWYDAITGGLWLCLAAIGIALRLRRMVRLHRIILVAPIDPRDEAYLTQVKRSTYLRLGVKSVLLVGAVIAVFDVAGLWWLWRAGLCLALALMLAETMGVDHIRDMLGRTTEARS